MIVMKMMILMMMMMMVIILQLTATIHTKQALSAILGMFNQTIDLRNEFGWKTSEDSEPMETEAHSGKFIYPVC